MLACLASMMMSSVVQAQTPGVRTGAIDARDGRRVSIEQRVEQAFRIEPVVQRFKGRRGEVIPFSFTVTSTGKTMQIDVSPIQLRQEESGIILHDEHSPPMEGVKFTTPTRFTLNAGETVELKGTVTIPLAKTNYLSFGLLVRDEGMVDEPTEDDAIGGQTRAAIRYVTQYVLRVDVETGLTNLSSIEQMEIEDAQVVSHEGMPYIRAYVKNPSNFALECRVRAELSHKESANASKSRSSDPIALFMPSRANLDDDEKYLVRMMPNARLRLEAPLETSLIDGRYDLNLMVSNGRRTMLERTFPQTLLVNSFRALDTRIANLGPGVTLEPAQIELGRVEGTQRMVTLEVKNNSDDDQLIHLVPRDHLGDPMSRLMLSSTKFELDAGRSKTIRALLRGVSKESSQWGTLDIIRRNLKSPNDVESATSLPLELVHQQRPQLTVAAGPLQWANLTDGNAFVIEVANEGEGYAPIQGELLLGRDDGSRPHRLLDGFGRWLAPGQKRELQFHLPAEIDAGRYQIRLTVRSRDNLSVEEQVVVLDLTDEMLQGSQHASNEAAAF
ncbi:hypothetical protein RBSH_03061 [Rhodopirellula baltica SH28]|uniref:Uncharacterized protein n=2 Tax=Rhodopirellula baltica TaxID=265606 RepID=K5DGN9_RHOBT|nr:hypothetical protein [Rhodopirellula baltica]EKK01608.1 hypothetical protein RBSH_03061 [Rhodopirellula baltica SH28]